MTKLLAIILLCCSLPIFTACGEYDQLPAFTRAALVGFSVRAPVASAASLDQESSLVLRRLWVGPEPDFWASTPSPDGRYVSDVDWITGDLAVIDLLTGELLRVTNKGTWDERVEWAEMSAFSPDGSQLAYVYWNQDLWGYELRVIDVDGSNERVLIPHREGLEWISVDDWSRDSGILVTLYWQADEEESVEVGKMALVSAETGEIEVLKGVDWFDPWNARLSPDGRFIAYEVKPPGQDDRDIHILATDGSLDELIVGGPTNDEMMDWTPDGSGILYYSDRALTKGVWRLPLRDGLPTGDADLIRADVWRAVPIGFAGESLYYGVHLESPQVSTASIDVAAGRMLTRPIPVEEPSGSQTVWSSGRSRAETHESSSSSFGRSDRRFGLRTADPCSSSRERRRMPIWACFVSSSRAVASRQSSSRPGRFRSIRSSRPWIAAASFMRRGVPRIKRRRSWPLTPSPWSRP
jgi:hypothetical protein